MKCETNNPVWVFIVFYAIFFFLSGKLETIQYLASQGVDLFAKDGEGKTALDIATENNYQAVIDYLKSKQDEKVYKIGFVLT